MLSLKEKLVSTFQKIQYDTEMLISNIDFNTKEYHVYNESLLKLRTLLMSRSTERIKQINEELHRYNDPEDISLYLDALAAENHEFTKLVSDKVAGAIAGEEIDDFIYQLKEENGDLFVRLSQKSEPIVQSIKENGTVKSVFEKSKEFVCNQKMKVETVKSKICKQINSAKKKGKE